ncbi:membrane protein [Tistrella bauzanensis]|uniref:Membrane protein n=1 Tax=Tistrella bauzanensis TaxID=657419 RepID=A0ABQ1IBC7_9PROT|nr:YjbE family putative metal transport protein [Tistrella bauzanensis]GGB29596.1 membrane protein [Tistrella bauzanensis]
MSADGLGALATVIMIDIVMSGDNAVIIGMAAAGLPATLRRKAIIYGILAATVLRIAFAAVTVQLLAIIGLTLAGGILLLWVAWRMWQELRASRRAAAAEAAAAASPPGASAGDGVDLPGAAAAAPKTMRQALTSIIIADVSMSLDNVLAVAGAAREHVEVLVIGLVLSIALMGLAANFVARLLERWHWLAYLGLAIITYVALDMILRGSTEVMQAGVFF